MHKICLMLLSLAAGTLLSAAADSLPAIDALASRVTNGTSEGRIIFVEQPSDTDFFEISGGDGKVTIAGNNPVSMATGLNWYLKYVAGIHIAWNNLNQALPAELPVPEEPIRKQTDMKDRYYLNYCTYSYSMPFWDFKRWEQEIDWMALHGINMPLSLTGAEVVWRNVLRRLGYSDAEVKEFVCGPAYMAWWLMNNLEGWGGPLPDEWFERQEDLQKRVVERMRSLGIDPVLPGYAGMVPRNIGEKLGYDIADPGRWCGFPRPAFLSPEDEHFAEMADIYYEELAKLFGTSRYYSMDPFHEGGNAAGVNLANAGQAIMQAMKRANPDAQWVIQSWQENPRHALIDTLAPGDMKILDLYSEKVPKWRRENAYGQHDWLYCMLLNFGGNVGLHGRMDSLIDGYYDARTDKAGEHLCGVGATPEGIENNPVMYELTFELPWRDERFGSREWLAGYLEARYGCTPEPEVLEAWEALRNTVYNAPMDYKGQGTVESLICARPSWDVRSASTWGYSELFYPSDSTAKAARLLQSVAPRHEGNANFQYDLTDVLRQANADRANDLVRQMASAHANGHTDSLRVLSEEFLALIMEQDSILSLCPDLSVDTWLDAAGNLASNPEDRELYRRNAAMLITVWGDERAANRGGLHDYSHREWGGLIRDLYYKRWKAFFDWQLNGAPEPDYYRMESEWVDKVSRS